MSDRNVHSRDSLRANYPAVERVVDAIAGWVNKYRGAVARHDEFAHCDPADVMRIASDLGIPAGELRKMAGKGPDGADLLQKLLVALHVDPNEITKTEPAVMRDLQRLCVSCTDKARCAHELDVGTACAHFHEYCPNAYTLDALFAERAGTVKH